MPKRTNKKDDSTTPPSKKRITRKRKTFSKDVVDASKKRTTPKKKSSSKAVVDVSKKTGKSGRRTVSTSPEKVEHDGDFYLWHPAVHNHFGESLWYFFIKERAHKDEVRRQIQGFLESISLGGYSYYDVYGNVDVVIRAWVRNESRDKLKMWFESNAAIGRFDSYICQGPPNYLWWDGYNEDEEDVVVPANDVRDLIAVQKNRGNPGIVSDLLSKGLLFKKRKYDTSVGLKFFMVISIDRPDEAPQLKSRVDEFLVAFNEPIEEISLYPISKTEFFLKAIVKEIRTIWDVVEFFTDSTFGNVQTATHVVARNPKHVSDDVTFQTALLQDKVVSMFTSWGISLGTVAAQAERLKPEEFTKLQEACAVIADHQEVSECDSEEILRNFVYGYLTQNRQTMVKQFFFLPEIERELRKSFGKWMATMLGKDWYSEHLPTIVNECELELDGDFDLEQITLKPLVIILAVAEKRGNQTIVGDILGENWNSILNSSTETRNLSVHGAIEPFENFSELIPQLIELLPIFYNLVSPKGNLES